MNSSRTYNILSVALVFILQLAVNDFLHLGPYVFICLIPAVIATLPVSTRPQTAMLEAFLLGLLFDLLSDGVPGLNAASATLAASLLKPIYKHTITTERQNKPEVSISRVGFLKVLHYTALVTGIYLLAYILIDCAGIRSALFIAIKFVISLIINVALAMLFNSILFNRD